MLNINTATAAELESLPGIGPVLAQRIVAHRVAHGPFGAIEDIIDVSGIGEGYYAQIRDLITVRVERRHMKAEVVLTVSESKRLIAKGVASLSYIQDKLEKGIIVVPSGSTNAYIYEELTGQTIDKRAYLAGRTWPAANKPDWQVKPMADLVLVDGTPSTEFDRFTALLQMQPGDVYVKGANALNYNAGVAGVSIGNPTGGTVGGSLGHIIGRKLRLLIPVGLEKEVPYDIVEASALLASDEEQLGSVLSLFPIHGEIFTEIEAWASCSGSTRYPWRRAASRAPRAGCACSCWASATMSRTRWTLSRASRASPL